MHMIQRCQPSEVVIAVSTAVIPLIQDRLAESSFRFSFSHVSGPVDVMEHKPLTTAYGNDKNNL
jgi:hypothetical protein